MTVSGVRGVGRASRWSEVLRSAQRFLERIVRQHEPYEETVPTLGAPGRVQEHAAIISYLYGRSSVLLLLVNQIVLLKLSAYRSYKLA